MNPDPPTPGLAVVVAATTSVQALATLGVLSVATIAPSVAASLGVSPALVGFQVSLIYCAGALTSAAAGSLVARWGACRTSQFAVLMVAAGCLLTVSGRLGMVAAAAAFIGVGYGLTNPASSHLLIRFTPERHRNLVFSLKQTGVPLGGVAAGLLLPPLSLALGWRGAIAGVGLLALLAGISLTSLREALDGDRRPSTLLRGGLLRGPLLAWRIGALRRMALLAFCFSALQLSLMTFLVTMLTQDLGFTLVLAGGVASAVQIAGAGGRLLWGWLADRLRAGTLTLLIIGALSTLCALGVAGFHPATPHWAVLPWLALFGLCAIGWNGVFLAEVARCSPPGAVGPGTGGALVFTFAGVAVGPALFAALHGTVHTYTLTFAVMSAFPAAGVLMLARHLRRAGGD